MPLPFKVVYPMGNTNQPARNDACGNGFRNVHFGRKRNSESRTGRESLDCWMTIFRVTEVGAEKASLVSFLYRMSHQKPMIDNSESQIPRIVSPQRAVKTRLAAAVANDERRRLPFFSLWAHRIQAVQRGQTRGAWQP